MLFQDKLLKTYQEMFVNYDQLEISVIKTSFGVDIEVIKAGAGDCLLLLPPMGCLATAWRYQFAEMAKLYQVISFHYPGCGLSSFNNDAISSVMISDIFIEVFNTLQTTGKAHFVGWSFGAKVSQLMYHRLKDTVSTLTMVNATSVLSKNPDNRGVSLILKLAEDFNRSKLLSPDKDMSISQINGIFSEEVRESYYNSKNTIAILPILQSITIPKLIIAGGQDEVTPPKLSQSEWEKLENVQMHILKDAGHYIPLFNYREFNKILFDFLKVHSWKKNAPR